MPWFFLTALCLLILALFSAEAVVLWIFRKPK